MRFVCKAIFLLLFAGTASAQHARQYSFRHFSVSNGLASNTVSATIQDGDGYIWMATVNGLQRYDGNSFITFRHDEKNPASIPSTHILSLFMDSHKNLWLLGDNRKAGIFDTRKFLFREVPFTATKTFYAPFGFSEWPGGELVFQSAGLLYQYKSKENRFVLANHIFSFAAALGFYYNQLGRS